MKLYFQGVQLTKKSGKPWYKWCAKVRVLNRNWNICLIYNPLGFCFSCGTSHLAGCSWREFASADAAWCPNHLSLDQRKVVSCTKTCLEEEWRSTAAQLSLGNDCNAVTKEISLVHVMCGQNDGAAWNSKGVKSGIWQTSRLDSVFKRQSFKRPSRYLSRRSQIPRRE